MWEGKDVVVTGATGLIGRAVANALARRGARVTGVSRTDPGSSLAYHPSIYFTTADLANPAACRGAMRWVRRGSVLFHCAAVTSGAADIVENPARHITPNVVMSATLLAAAHAADVGKVVFPSSSTVYPESGRAIAEDQGFVGEPYHKYHGVGWMKRYVEKLCQFYSHHIPGRKLPCVVVRPANVYGPHDKFDPRRSHVIGSLIRKVVEAGPDGQLEVWGDGSEVRDFVYVDDLADGMIRAAEIVDDYDPINLGSGVGVPVVEVVDLIRRLVGKPGLKIEYQTDAPTTIPCRVLDTTKAEVVLGWTPRVSLPDGLERTIRWYEENLGAGVGRAD